MRAPLGSRSFALHRNGRCFPQIEGFERLSGELARWLGPPHLPNRCVPQSGRLALFDAAFNVHHRMQLVALAEQMQGLARSSLRA